MASSLASARARVDQRAPRRPARGVGRRVGCSPCRGRDHRWEARNFYPSGFHLDGIANHLTELLERMQVRLGFDELAVVAHSMGGLVSRGAILKYAQETGRVDVRLFVTLSTPWGGRASDGTVSVASQTRPEAQEQAASVRAFDRTHAGILHDEAVVRRVNRLLDSCFP